MGPVGPNAGLRSRRVSILLPEPARRADPWPTDFDP
jgi:hypothetical protein